MIGSWNHATCWACWRDLAGDDRVPHRVKDDVMRPCCRCGTRTDAGIYVRHKPGELKHCGGE